MTKDEVLDGFAGKSVLVTGGAGMIGRQVVDLLCSAGASVRNCSLDEFIVDDRPEHVRGDLTDFGLCKEVTRDMDAVCHVAGIKGSVGVSETRMASHLVPMLMMSVNVLEACRLNRVERAVYTSSIGAYRQAELFREEPPGAFDDSPMDVAGWAKRMGELQIHAYKVQYGIETYSAVRPSNVYGPGDNFDPESALVIGALMSRIHNGDDPVVVWGDGSAIRDFVFSRDVAEGIILALHHGTGGRYVNLGSGQEHSIRELVETLHSFLDFSYEFDPSKPSGFPRRVMDISLARELIDYSPTTSLRDGLKQTWDWYVNHQDEHLGRMNYFKDTNHAAKG